MEPDHAASASPPAGGGSSNSKRRTITDPILNLRAHVRFLFEPTPTAPLFNGFDIEYNVRFLLGHSSSHRGCPFFGLSERFFQIGFV